MQDEKKAVAPSVSNELLDRPLLKPFKKRSAERQEKVDAFHAHLDACAQCENQSFNLCHVGRRLILDAV